MRLRNLIIIGIAASSLGGCANWFSASDDPCSKDYDACLYNCNSREGPAQSACLDSCRTRETSCRGRAFSAEESLFGLKRASPVFADIRSPSESGS